MALTPKENFLACIRHETYDYVPDIMADASILGFGGLPGPAFEKGPFGGGPDGFNITWVTPSSGGGAPIPQPGKFILNSENIEDWKKIVTFPNLAAFDWERQVAMETEIMHTDRNMQAVDFGSGNGPFERLASLMGFEEALLSMALEPEATQDLLNAICDWKIHVYEYVKKYYNPDTITNYDDIATERGPFMSPETYRTMIKPLHKKMNEAAIDMGMIPIQHTCGKCDIFIDDFIETKAAGWTSVQPTNNIAKMLQDHGHEFAIIGGFDSNGPATRPTASIETIHKEIERCYREYAQYSGFIMFAFRIVNTLDSAELMSANMPMIQKSMELRQSIFPIWS